MPPWLIPTLLASGLAVGAFYCFYRELRFAISVRTRARGTIVESSWHGSDDYGKDTWRHKVTFMPLFGGTAASFTYDSETRGEVGAELEVVYDPHRPAWAMRPEDRGGKLMLGVGLLYAAVLVGMFAASYLPVG